MIKFEWDLPKATANLKKHQVSFDEAKSVFYDEFAVQFFKLEPEYLRPRAKIVLLMYDPPVPGDDLRRLAGMPPMLFPKQVLIRR